MYPTVDCTEKIVITDKILCVLVTQYGADNQGVRQIEIGIRKWVLLSLAINFRIKVLPGHYIIVHG